MSENWQIDKQELTNRRSRTDKSMINKWQIEDLKLTNWRLHHEIGNWGDDISNRGMPSTVSMQLILSHFVFHAAVASQACHVGSIFRGKNISWMAVWRVFRVLIFLNGCVAIYIIVIYNLFVCWMCQARKTIFLQMQTDSRKYSPTRIEPTW